jgi:hypothetical protein
MMSDIGSRRETRPGRRHSYLARMVFGAIAELAGHTSYRLDVLRWWAERLETVAVRRGPHVRQ